MAGDGPSRLRMAGVVRRSVGGAIACAGRAFAHVALKPLTCGRMHLAVPGDRRAVGPALAAYALVVGGHQPTCQLTRIPIAIIANRLNAVPSIITPRLPS